jgi:cyclopropane-fatty-acyl-phospholipid synthase
MSSTQAQIDHSYSLSNDFFSLWLDRNMHYTSAVYAHPDQSLEDAQENKSRILYDFAELGPNRTACDIGSGWGSTIDVIVRRGIREVHGITLSTEQYQYCLDRKIPNARWFLTDYADYVPDQPYDGLVSVEMIDHLVSPAQARAGLAVDLYRAYFRRLADWVRPGSAFGFQAILRNRIPRQRKDLEDLAFTADVIFPGGLNPRIEELVQAVAPWWEIEQLHMRRTDYLRTTSEWLRRFEQHSDEIERRWGALVVSDYRRYLSTCVRAFTNHWSGDVQMKLRRI